MEISERDKFIAEHISWLVGRTLSYIDVTIEDSKDPNDRYSKKEVLKKLFEKEIYEVRNSMFATDTQKIIDNIDTIFSDLVEVLINLVSASIASDTCRKSFISLVDKSCDAAKNRIMISLQGE